jgi:hypothetical protein
MKNQTAACFVLIFWSSALALLAAHPSSDHEITNSGQHYTTTQLESWLQAKFQEQMTTGPETVDLNYWISTPPAGLINKITNVYFSVDGREIYIHSQNEKTLVYDLVTQKGHRTDPDLMNKSAVPGTKGRKGWTQSFIHYPVHSPDKAYILHITKFHWPFCYIQFSIEFTKKVVELPSLTPEQNKFLGIMKAFRDEGRSLNLDTKDHLSLLEVFRTFPPALQFFLARFNFVTIALPAWYMGWLDWYFG